MYVKMSYMCLIFKTKLFRSFIAKAIEREKAALLVINDIQIN